MDGPMTEPPKYTEPVEGNLTGQVGTMSQVKCPYPLRHKSPH